MEILHAGDFHLDAPFSGLTPEQAALRRGEQRAMLGRLSDLARQGGADLVLLSGDLFDDGGETYGETLDALCRSLGQTGCPVCIAPGNHDPYNSRSPYAHLAWPENVHIFKGEGVESVYFADLNCTVYGSAFAGRSRETSPIEGFHAEADGIKIGLFHGDVGGRGDYAPISEGDIAGSGLDYLALGHVHGGSGLQRAGGTHWAYPGCAIGRGFDELGEKGCLWVTVDGQSVTAKTVPLGGRKYEILEVAVGDDPATALLTALPDDSRDHIYRILLTGESDVAGLDLTALHRLVADRCFSVNLRDCTTVRRDLWARKGEDSLTGLFLQEMERKVEEADDDETKGRLTLAVRFGLAALEHGEEPMA